jgi:DNA-binding CsgD family transcriptional regulator
MKGISGYFPHEPDVARDLLAQRLGLSRREAEVIWWVTHEKTNDEIGTVLGVSSATVKTHLQNVFDRLNTHSKVGLAVLATLILSRKDGRRFRPAKPRARRRAKK